MKNLFIDWDAYDEDVIPLIQKAVSSKYKNVKLLLNPRFNSGQCLTIIEGLKLGLDASIYAKPEFNEYQMREIKEGLNQGLDVSVYAKPEFDYDQMFIIRRGLEEGIDVSIYSNPDINYDNMDKIYEELLQEKLDSGILTETVHDYSCVSGNYFSAETTVTFDSWEDFKEEWIAFKDNDPDFKEYDDTYHFLFRYDIFREMNNTYSLQLCTLLQRKGIYTKQFIENLSEEDLNGEIKIWLKARSEYMKKLWGEVL